MKICILAAGRGTRMGPFSNSIHKALLPLGNKAILTHIINQFHSDNEFIIAVGFKSYQVKDYIKIAHPDLNVTFVDVKNFEGEGSGPGLSLLECKEELQEPFIFTACDTLVKSEIPSANENWMGVKEVDDIKSWCSVKADENRMISEIIYKEDVDTNLAFVGIAGVSDYEAFWQGMTGDGILYSDELQVNNGLERLIDDQLRAVDIHWEDAGNEKNYTKLLKQYDKNYSFDGKTTDLTYHIDDKVIKFFEDQEIAQRRYLRAQNNEHAFAKVQAYEGNFYSYTYCEGTLLSDLMSAQECTNFLEWAQIHLWKDCDAEEVEFAGINKDFYYHKTIKRLEKFCFDYLVGQKEEECTINGLPCLTVRDLLEKLEDSFYSTYCASTYHGDLHDNNIIVADGSYTLIDWRDSFDKSSAVGDRYYDLAKFLHTLELSVPVMEAGQYNVTTTDSGIELSHEQSAECKEAEKAFWSFVHKYKYNVGRIRIIDALIFINMSPLYAEDMGTYLYYLGRYELQKAMKEVEVSK